jgi:hypothetical protein
MNPWRKRVGLIACVLGVAACLAVIAGLTWAIFYIHQEKSKLFHVDGEITKVVSAKRASLARSIGFGKYTLNVRYRTKDGSLMTDSIEERSYGFPSAGDSIGLLIDPSSGAIETNPFPELWFVLATVYAGVGGLIFMFVKIGRAAHRL